MIARDRFALNRSVCPTADLEGFFELAARLDLRKVELRNDLPGGTLDGRTASEVASLARAHRMSIITINALQNFNVAARLPELRRELEALLDVAAAIGCAAIILCPSHSPADDRNRDTVIRETVGALHAFRPLFEANGVMGFVEPIGMKSCSLRSLVEAQRAIREAGGSCYRIVYDTFHHYTGPDTDETVERMYDASATGLVHVSGVARGVASPVQLIDEARAMIGTDDLIGNVEQIERLEKKGFRGPVSFEPFSPEVHRLDRGRLEEAIRRSIETLQRGVHRRA
jgi:2-keto-myo-inositol isomerase